MFCSEMSSWFAVLANKLTGRQLSRLDEWANSPITLERLAYASGSSYLISTSTRRVLNQLEIGIRFGSKENSIID